VKRLAKKQGTFLKINDISFYGTPDCHKITFVWRNLATTEFLSQKKKHFFRIFNFWFQRLFYMHLLILVSFGLIGYVPNTWYIFLPGENQEGKATVYEYFKKLEIY
jgi:hypothetical protein